MMSVARVRMVVLFAICCAVSVSAKSSGLSPAVSHSQHYYGKRSSIGATALKPSPLQASYGDDLMHHEEQQQVSEHEKLSVLASASMTAAAPAAQDVTTSFNMSEALKLAGIFGIWYALNAAYNVYNAYSKKGFPNPWSTSTYQFSIGMVYALPLWLSKVRKIPSLNFNDVLTLVPIAALSAFGHTAAVIAMFEKGGGSFTHVIKASEPVISVLLNLLINHIVPKPVTTLTLFPIVYGVAYASTLGNLNPSSMSRELTTKAAIYAMTSNVMFALRSILRRRLGKDFKQRTNLDPANEHAVSTALSALMLIPIALYKEGPTKVMNSLSQMPSQASFFTHLTLSGLTFYLYNEMQNKVLHSLGPVPTAVGNTLKRVVIFGALYLFTQGETFPPAKVLGCAIAVTGCMAFAIADSKKI